jgi:hypothetical protein
MDPDGFKILPDRRRNLALIDQFGLGFLKDFRQVILKFRKDALFLAIITGGTGIEDFGKMGAGGYLPTQPGPDQPHPAPRGIGVPTEGLVGGTIKVNIIFRELTIAAPKTTMDDFGMFYFVDIFHLNHLPVAGIHNSLRIQIFFDHLE